MNCTVSVADWLGFRVSGKLAPETLKSAPVTVAALIVTAADPVDVIVIDFVEGVFSGTLPKLTEVGLTVSWGVVGAVPVPLSAICVVPPLLELLVNVSWPDSALVTVGVNCTVNVADWLGFRVSGKLAPETLKSAPVTVAALIVTAADPVDVMVIDFVEATFNGTLPKLTEVGLTVSWGVVVEVPDPPSDTVAGPEGSSLPIVSVPLSFPTAVGS